ncbi:MAG: hypothetical protein SGILL_009722, partial [Bacillariaceae sp.]
MSSPESKKRTLESSQEDDVGGGPSGERSKRISLSPTTGGAKTLPASDTGETPPSEVASANNGVDASDDDSVEFLFTLPPDPPRPQNSYSNRHQAEPPPDSSNNNNNNNNNTTNNDAELDTTMNVGPSEGQTATQAAAETVAQATAAQSPSQTRLLLYSHRSSAYLQTLAEICYAILWDGRWRVGGSKTLPLFAWERGEDLSAMHYLSRRYILPDHNRKGKHEESLDAAAKEDGDEGNAAQTASSAGANETNGDDDDELDRCLETYCRMYFRKGPWFRLDNIYSSYYLPKRARQPQSALSDPNASNSPQQAQEAEEKKPMSPSKFFLPASQRPKKKKSPPASKDKQLEAYIDQDFVDQQLEAVRVMLCDIQRLSGMGLIRFFRSEEECGKTVGNMERYQTSSSSILRQDEQRSILAMLGGGKNRKRPSPSNTGSSGGGDSSRRFSFGSTTAKSGSQPSSSENLIWKQMCQQQTIFKSFTPTSASSDSNNHILPVAKHVHRALVEKWAASIVLKASKVEYIPSTIHRQATKVVCDKLMGWTAAFGDDILTAMCCRLREAPLKTLRRGCRLHLCATSGPGDMRGDASNAWRSLPDKYPHMDLQKLPMRTNNVPPPGSNSWNMISYPGKDWRMRLIGCNFVQSYVPLEVNDANSYTNQVFASIRSFHSWEAGIELRANGDYLLELNDLLHYTERKR